MYDSLKSRMAKLKIKLGPRRMRRKLLVSVEKAKKAVKLRMFRPKFDKHYSTGKEKAYTKFGKGFFDSFETESFTKNGITKFKIAPLRDSVHSDPTQQIMIINNLMLGGLEAENRLILMNDLREQIAWVNIGFEKDSLIIESMQTIKRKRKYLNDFRRITGGKPALDCLLEEDELTAKRRGFKFVKIRSPESLYYYSVPVLMRTRLTEKQARRQMKILYQKIALRHGHKKMGLFYIKELNPKQANLKH